MNKIFSLKAFLLLISVSGSTAVWAQGNDVDNGGDPLRIIFFEGRKQAAALVADIKNDDLDLDIDAAVRQWILANKAELAQDIAGSKHLWSDDPQTTCARTQRYRGSEIRLSFWSCRQYQFDKEAAGKLLVHESVHHFNIPDEEFADAVAVAVYTVLAPQTDATSRPRNEDICVDIPDGFVVARQHANLAIYEINSATIAADAIRQERIGDSFIMGGGMVNVHLNLNVEGNTCGARLDDVAFTLSRTGDTDYALSLGAVTNIDPLSVELVACPAYSNRADIVVPVKLYIYARNNEEAVLTVHLPIEGDDRRDQPSMMLLKYSNAAGLSTELR